MNPSGHRVEIRHQTVAQLVIVDKRLVGRMVVGCDIPDFTRRPLAVYTEQGYEAAELAPTGLQLTPLLQVFILHLHAVVQLLSCHIATLHTEAALIHTPEGQSRCRVVQSRRHLSPHILPTGTNITTPCGCRIALFTSKTTTCQQEYTLVGVNGTLAIVDGISIDDAIGIEILC